MTRAPESGLRIGLGLRTVRVAELLEQFELFEPLQPPLGGFKGLARGSLGVRAFKQLERERLSGSSEPTSGSEG